MQQKPLIAQELAEAMRAGCLGSRIGRLHRTLTRTYEHALRPLGLSLPQMEILTALVLVPGPVRPTELAEMLSVERSTISRNLALMQSHGWVAAPEISPTGRSMTVAITKLGTETFANAKAAWEQAQAQAIAHLGPDAPAYIDAWLDALDDGSTSEAERDR